MFFPHRKRRFVGDNGLLAGAVLFLACTLASVLWARVAHAGDPETLRVENLPMNHVTVRGAVQVEISQGEPAVLLMRGPAEQLAVRPFIAREKLLVLGDSEQDPRADVSDVRYKLTLPSLEALHVAGSGTVYVRRLAVGDLDVSVDGSGDARFFAVDGEDIHLAVNGSGDLEVVELRAEGLEVVVAGAGDVRFRDVTVEDRIGAVIKGSGDIVAKGEGRSAAMKLAIVGSGDIDFRRINATDVEVNIVGSGDARVGGVLDLDVTVLGSGDVYYRGEPDISTTILGSGRLHDSDD
ncbi:MAG: GIN domain-containing protein [Pseudohaliea sp.]